MNTHKIFFSRKIEDLYNQLEELNSNSFNNTLNYKPSSKKKSIFNTNISDEKLLMYDLMKRQPKSKNTIYSYDPINIDSKIKKETRDFANSRTIFDIPSYDPLDNILKKNNPLKNNNSNFMRKYGEVENLTEYFKKGQKENYQNKSNNIKNLYQLNLINYEHLPKSAKLKIDIIQILRNNKYNNSRNTDLIRRGENRKNLTNIF